MTTMITFPKPPGWFLAVVIVVALPVFQFPVLLANCPADSPDRAMIWFYPFYVIMTGFLAYITYPRRPVLAWLLLALMILTHAAIWLLVTDPGSHPSFLNINY